METIKFVISEKEAQSLKELAEQRQLSVSNLAKGMILRALEDEADLKRYQQALAEHQQKDESISHEEMKTELGL